MITSILASVWSLSTFSSSILNRSFPLCRTQLRIYDILTRKRAATDKERIKWVQILFGDLLRCLGFDRRKTLSNGGKRILDSELASDRLHRREWEEESLLLSLLSKDDECSVRRKSLVVSGTTAVFDIWRWPCIVTGNLDHINLVCVGIFMLLQEGAETTHLSAVCLLLDFTVSMSLIQYLWDLRCRVFRRIINKLISS